MRRYIPTLNQQVTSCDQFVTKSKGIQGYSGVFGNKDSL